MTTAKTKKINYDKLAKEFLGKNPIAISQVIEFIEGSLFYEQAKPTDMFQCVALIENSDGTYEDNPLYSHDGAAAIFDLVMKEIKWHLKLPSGKKESRKEI